ncbi:MAG: phosphoglucosamine mutase [bacterium]|nr:phosphoglucosamine mutase [bacterium]
MHELIFSISGVRGVVGESLTPEVVSDFGKAFGTFIIKQSNTHSIRRKIVVGRDARESGNVLKEAFVSGVLSTGLDVVDIGLSPTPTVLFNVRPLKADGSAVITASHNPSEWNGIKFANKNGIFLNTQEIIKLYEIYKNKKFVTNGKGALTHDSNSLQRHKEAIFNSIDSKLIQSKQFKVILDSAQGVVSKEGTFLLKQLGCKFWEEDYTRKPEPTQENLSHLSIAVKSKGADIGFATDPDGDRLSLVTEKGEVLGEEYTLPLVASWILSKRKGMVVTNLSTSKMVEDIAIEKGCRIIKTKVGEVNVVEQMLRTSAVLGGEGNGGVIDPVIQYTRDSLVGIGRILEYMAISGEKLSSLTARVPKYYMVKKKTNCPENIDFESFLNLLPAGEINMEDGLRIDFTDGWIHIRKSNTEPILRIICETKDEKLTRSLVKEVKRCVE